MLSHDSLKQIHRLQLQSQKLVQGALTGSYLSAFQGQGMQFSEAREYCPGDDIRTIDWNVTARMQKPYVKIFTEERELHLNLLLDLSPSVNWGSQSKTKRSILAEVAAFFALSAAKNADCVSLVLHSEELEKYLPSRKGVPHCFRLIHEILAHPPKYKGSRIDKMMNFANAVYKKGSRVLVFTDLIGELQRKDLALSCRKFDSTFVVVRDPRDYFLPEMGLVDFVDANTGEILCIDTSDSFQRESYTKRAEEAFEKKCQMIRREGGDLIILEGEKQLFSEVIKYLKRRRR